MTSHPYYDRHRTFNYLHDTCFITGLACPFQSGIVEVSHILDRCLLKAGDPRLYDPNVTIKMDCRLHRLREAGYSFVQRTRPSMQPNPPMVGGWKKSSDTATLGVNQRNGPQE